ASRRMRRSLPRPARRRAGDPQLAAPRRRPRRPGRCAARGEFMKRVGAALLLLGACGGAPSAGRDLAGEPVIPERPFVIRAGQPVDVTPGEERRLRNLRKLTSGGENAEAYWSFDGRRLIYQSKRKPYDCDQLFVLDLETGQQRMVSTGKGKCTYAYFLRGDR